jgi:hypothetical protein
MDFTTHDESIVTSGEAVPLCRLYVSWQHPDTRQIVPVGMLSRSDADGATAYEFRYLKAALSLDGFSAFVGFPDFTSAYRSEQLFPFFENRLMPRGRDDYNDFLASLGLPQGADPFEVLARSEAKRATDAIEVFPEPTVSADGIASCRFLVRGIRHLPHAQEAIESLTLGERLFVVLDPQNKVDQLAILLRNGQYEFIGYLPRFLTSLVHAPHLNGDIQDVCVRVEHIGDVNGPVHIRLLCRVEVPWPNSGPVLNGPEYEPVQA